MDADYKRGGGGQIKADALAPKTNINQPPGNRQNDGKKTGGIKEW